MQIIEPKNKEYLIHEEECLRTNFDKVYLLQFKQHCSSSYKLNNAEIDYLSFSLKEKYSSSNNNNNQKRSIDSNNSERSTFDSSKKDLNMLDSDDYFQIPNFIDDQNTIKLLLIGDKQVGKTSLKNKIIENISASTSKIFDNKKTARKTKSKFEIWDTNSQIINSPIFLCKFCFYYFYE